MDKSTPVTCYAKETRCFYAVCTFDIRVYTAGFTSMPDSIRLEIAPSIVVEVH